MSKLDKILQQYADQVALASALDAAYDEQQIKDLMLELIGKDYAADDEPHSENGARRWLNMKGYNQAKAELRQRVNEL